MALLYVAGLAACESSSDPVATPTPSTEAPKSATVAPAPSRPSGLPSTAVAAEESGRLVVVNVATGEVLRILRTFSDLRTVAPEGGHAFPRDITLAPDGTIAYLDWCCEPAAGDIRRIPTAGGDGAGADSVAHGYGPSVSPNGASVAWGTYMSGITIRTGDQQRLVPGPERPTDLLYTATAWVDDRRIAYVRSTPGGHVTKDQVYIHNIAAPDLLGDRLLAEVKDVRDLVRRGDGSLVWVGSDGVGHVLDPETSRETAAFELGGDVRDIAYDATGTWLLYTTQTRELRWTGGGRSGSIPGKFVAAGW
jgi:hypothetical protein